MLGAPDEAPFPDVDIDARFASILESGALLAVSGGSDSIALMHLVRHAIERKGITPADARVTVATVDHGLRAESVAEAAFVAKAARRSGFEHVTLRWAGGKPVTGIQAAAREARYALLASEARRRGLSVIATAHTLDDQAETVLMRLARGSGLKGLGAMPRCTMRDGVTLARPLLDVTRARLRAELARQGLSWIDDPSNADPRYLRARLRRLLPHLAAEGLDAPRLADIARKARRADAALEAATEAAYASLVRKVPSDRGPILTIARSEFAALPLEIAMRALARALAAVAPEADPPLDAALETLVRATQGERATVRATIAGALVSVGARFIRVRTQPPRRRLE